MRENKKPIKFKALEVGAIKPDSTLTKFKIENFGPVKEGEIEIGDITLFLGYPSTGKSYIMRSLYPVFVFSKFGTLFIPYYRELSVLIPDDTQKDIGYMFGLSYSSFIAHFHEGKKILKNQPNEGTKKYIIDLLRSLVGDIQVDDDNRIYYMNDLSLPTETSAMTTELTAMLIPLLDIQTPAYVFIEEPEAHIHYAYQLVLAVMFLSLVNLGYKFVISTHSDVFGQFLGELVKYKPSKEKISELLKNIIGDIPPIFGKMTERAVEALKQINLKTYYFEKDGKVTEKSIDQLIITTPGISVEVMDKLFDWTFEVSSEND